MKDKYFARFVSNEWHACIAKSNEVSHGKYLGCLNCCPPLKKILNPNYKLFNGKMIIGSIKEDGFRILF